MSKEVVGLANDVANAFLSKMTNISLGTIDEELETTGFVDGASLDEAKTWLHFLTDNKKTIAINGEHIQIVKKKP